MKLWQEKQKDDADYLRNLTDTIVNEIGGSKPYKYPADEVAAALTQIKIRDAFLYKMRADTSLVEKFIDWWNSNSVELRHRISAEQKSMLLGTLAGALLLIDMEQHAVDALKLSAQYAANANVPIPGLTKLLLRAVSLNLPTHVWKDSVSQTTLDEIFGDK